MALQSTSSLHTASCTRRHCPTTGLIIKARGHVACKVAQQQVPKTPDQISQAWLQFGPRFSGEWEGVTATFEPNGKVIPLDPHYVPGAYREWGVELYDWQTTCSTLADEQTPQQVQLTCRRMMPTVGCEADAIAFTTETASSDTGSQSLLAFSPDGSYISGPQELQADQDSAVLECGLMLGTSSSSSSSSSSGADNSSGPTYRIRILHHLQRYWQNKEWQLYKVDVHHERWDSTYRGKVELCGCGGGMVPFGSTSPMDTQQVLPPQPPSTWAEACAFVPDGDTPGRTQCAGPAAADQVLSSAPSLTADHTVSVLPLGVYYHLSVSGKEGDVVLDVGAQLREGDTAPAASSSLRAAQLVFKQGKLLAAAVGLRHASS